MILPIKTVLTNARRAFDAGTLQIQSAETSVKTGTSCTYSGPCVIGVSLPIELRQQFDTLKIVDGSTIEEGATMGVGGLIELGLIESDCIGDLCVLQQAHDSFDLSLFENVLIMLEVKHGLRAMD